MFPRLPLFHPWTLFHPWPLFHRLPLFHKWLLFHQWPLFHQSPSLQSVTITAAATVCIKGLQPLQKPKHGQVSPTAASALCFIALKQTLPQAEANCRTFHWRPSPDIGRA